MSIKGAGGGAGGGSNTPGAPNTSVQFNNGGNFAGDANLTWVGADGLTDLKHAAFGADAVIDVYSFGGYPPSPTVVNIGESFTTNGETGLSNICEFNPSIAGQSAYNAFFELDTKVGNNTNILDLEVITATAQHLSTSTVDVITCVSAGIYNQSTGSIGIVYGLYSSSVNNAAGTITDVINIFSGNSANGGGGTITTQYGLFIDNQTAGVTNFAIKTGLGLVSFGDDVVTTADMKAATYHVGAAAGIDASITTATLVGKTITVSKGLITGFA